MLILSGDQLYRMDFRKVIAQHIATGADVTIAAQPVPVSKIEDLGAMRVDDNLEIKQFAEKPKDAALIDSLAMSPALEARLTTRSTGKRCLASMGIYVFSRGVLQQALDNSMRDFGKEVIPSLLGRKRPGRTGTPVQFLHAHDADLHPRAFPPGDEDQPLHD